MIYNWFVGESGKNDIIENAQIHDYGKRYDASILPQTK